MHARGNFCAHVLHLRTLRAQDYYFAWARDGALSMNAYLQSKGSLKDTRFGLGIRLDASGRRCESAMRALERGAHPIAGHGGEDGCLDFLVGEILGMSLFGLLGHVWVGGRVLLWALQQKGFKRSAASKNCSHSLLPLAW